MPAIFCLVLFDCLFESCLAVFSQGAPATNPRRPQNCNPEAGTTQSKSSKKPQGCDVRQINSTSKLSLRQIKEAIEATLRTIAKNAGAEGSVVVDQVKREGKGFNAETLTFEDLAANGVVDPTKVVRQCIQNASSIAGLLLTTEAIMAELPEEEVDTGHGHSHH